MKLVVGLGNPGLEYVNTRHNVGYIFVDQIPNKSKILIFKSQNFMNESGLFVKKMLNSNNLDSGNLIIAHDDLDIPLGEFKIQYGKGPKDHNGILDIEDKLGTKNFWRVRIGVDNRPNDNRPMGEEYVLQNFSDEEKVVLDRVIKEACKKLETLLVNTK